VAGLWRAERQRSAGHKLSTADRPAPDMHSPAMAGQKNRLVFFFEKIFSTCRKNDNVDIDNNNIHNNNIFHNFHEKNFTKKYFGKM